jgi:hypothetical protein
LTEALAAADENEMRFYEAETHRLKGELLLKQDRVRGVFGGSLIGMLLGSILHEDYLSSDSKDVIKLVIGLIATMSALVLALLISRRRLRTIFKGAKWDG